MKSPRTKCHPLIAAQEDPQWLKVIERLATALEESGYYFAAIKMRFQCSKVRRKILLADTFTERLSVGNYRVSVLVAGDVTSTFYIIRSHQNSGLWSIWPANDDYHSILTFKTLKQAKEHCVHLTM